MINIKGIINHFLKKDGSVQAPPLCWKTSAFGSACRYFWNVLILDNIKPNKAGKEFCNIMLSRPDRAMVEEACRIFEKETGKKMFMTHPEGANSFSTNANILIRDIKEGVFPKDIDYIVIGHGAGSSVNGTWHVAADPDIKIFDYIREHIPEGKKVLVNCCEHTPKDLIPKDKPAIGKPASEFYSSYKFPAKIVQNNSIIGGYANGIVTYYR